ncbi:MAG: hypothetical protein BGO08_05815 [Altererythrobacter sp. 66-12]|nr:MAG: hypothetical protein BGO08_05815 [Altererythrobacter sp. 66-12]
MFPTIAGERQGAAPKEDIARQVRIEERVVIRIAPSNPARTEQALSAIPRRTPGQTTFREQKLDGCIPVAAIAAVQPAEQNRLLLFMRDRQVLSAALERACNSDDFYSGFYIERQPDGQLCSNRDQLQSRAGASCRVAQINRLVAVRD